jgi:hypothetical protein
MASQILTLVRDLLVDDLDAYQDRTSGLDGAGWNAFSEVVGAAFQRGVSDRFGAAAESAAGTAGDGVAALVDSARRPYLGSSLDVDREAAQVLVRSVLGRDRDHDVAGVLARFDEPDLARIELVLLRRLVSDAGLTGESLDGFLADAESVASPWATGVAGRQGRGREGRDEPFRPVAATRR